MIAAPKIGAPILCANSALGKRKAYVAALGGENFATPLLKPSQTRFRGGLLAGRPPLADNRALVQP